MKKFLVFIVVVLVLVFANLTFGQDCGKCPHKKDCNSTKEKQTVKKEEVQTPMVYVNKSDKLYHQKGCELIKDQEGYTAVTLKKAIGNGLNPCSKCQPPVPTKKEKEPKKEEKKK